jgi:membrane-associated phospholipid phosphatase
MIWQVSAVIGILVGLRVFFGELPSTEYILVAFVAVFMWNARNRGFLIDFSPFVILIISYESLRGFADNLSPSDVNITNLIEWEKSLFGGTIPSHYLQQHLWGQFYTPVLDVVTNVLYVSHFFAPVLLAVILWHQGQRPRYWAYAIGLVMLSYAAFATYLLFPAAPPWWATLNGYLPDQPATLAHFVVPESAVESGPNPVAAMPSLHTGYPTYIAMVAIATWRKKGLPVLLLPTTVIFAIVYLGHHYVIDALAGIAYAAVVFALVFVPVSRFVRNHDLQWGRQPAPAPKQVRQN